MPEFSRIRRCELAQSSPNSSSYATFCLCAERRVGPGYELPWRARQTGYDLHITRKENWFDPSPGFSLEDWLAYVEGDPELRHDGFAEAALNGGKVLRVEQKGLCVWTAYSGGERGNDLCWLAWSGSDNIDAKNTDPEIRRKMWSIAEHLGARVQGDDGEFYGPEGEPIAAIAPASSTAKHPWWRFW
jgi:hypothetical protein